MYHINLIIVFLSMVVFNESMFFNTIGENEPLLNESACSLPSEQINE